MPNSPARKAATAALAAIALVGIAACSPPDKSNNSSSTTSSGSGGGSSTADAKSATSAEAMGGMAALEAAAKAEGQLNVIALPPTWANYGEVIKAFTAKYGIKVNSDQPDGSSADEIATAKRLSGQSGAPDVFDLGQSVALANTAMFAPYQVATWKDIPDNFKDANGTWVNDYGGYMSVGYDSAKVPAPTKIEDLLKPEYKGKVALNGDPTQAGAAFAGVQMVSIALGGSASDISKGVDFFKQLKDAGNLIPVDPTPATIESGQTPVVIDWDYLGLAAGKNVPTWKAWVPPNAALAGYYFQAINKEGPHPAAARLWEEFLYSDEGQNLWLKGGARPVRLDAMIKAGTADATAAAALPKVEGTPVTPTEAESNTAKDYLTKNWANAVG